MVRKQGADHWIDKTRFRNISTQVDRGPPVRDPAAAAPTQLPVYVYVGRYSPWASIRSSTRRQIWSRESSAAVCGSSIAA
ncbi:hypothetical protein BH24CHL3_BH24CHL3_11070 [soil metagenome]